MNSYRLLLLVSMVGSAARAAPILSIQPAPTTILQGASDEWDISISGVTDLYALQFDLEFDPTILSASAITEGLFLPSAGPTFFLPGAIDNGSGTITFNADTLIGAVPGVSGDGTLALVAFTALGAGTSAIRVTNVELLDSSLDSISFGTSDSTVTVAEAPEPSTLPMFTFALLLGAVVMHSKRHRIFRREGHRRRVLAVDRGPLRLS